MKSLVETYTTDIKAKRKNEKFKLSFVFRMPEFPLIIVSKGMLLSAFCLQELAVALNESEPLQDAEEVNCVDVSGSHFVFNCSNSFLAPAWTSRNWSKMKIIEIFNSSQNAEKL